MIGNNYVPEKGDFVTMNFDPQSGHEQAGHRPAVILSPSSYNGKTGLCLVCPITNSIKGYAFEVNCDSSDVTGVILSDQAKSLDWKARNIKYKGKASLNVLEEVTGKLGTLLY